MPLLFCLCGCCSWPTIIMSTSLTVWTRHIYNKNLYIWSVKHYFHAADYERWTFCGYGNRTQHKIVWWNKRKNCWCIPNRNCEWFKNGADEYGHFYVNGLVFFFGRAKIAILNECLSMFGSQSQDLFSLTVRLIFALASGPSSGRMIGLRLFLAETFNVWILCVPFPSIPPLSF